MRKKLVCLLALSFLLSLTACGSNGNEQDNAPDAEASQSAPQEPPKSPPLTESEIKQMYTDPTKFTGRQLELTGQVFSSPEYDEDGVYFQMWGDPEGQDLNTVVVCFDPELELESDEYVRITGEVVDVFEGENMMGGKIVAPMVRADSLETVSYMDAVMPTLYTAMAEENSIDQYGYVVTIEKVELAESETRAYITVTNNGSESFDLYRYNAKIIQNGKQYEQETNYYAEYPEIQSDLSVGVTTEGILTFPAIEATDFQLILPGASGNWEERIDDYTFNFSIQE